MGLLYTRVPSVMFDEGAWVTTTVLPLVRRIAFPFQLWLCPWRLMMTCVFTIVSNDVSCFLLCLCLFSLCFHGFPMCSPFSFLVATVACDRAFEEEDSVLGAVNWPPNQTEKTMYTCQRPAFGGKDVGHRFVELVLVFTNSEDGGRRTQDLCADCWKDAQEGKEEQEPVDKSKHLDDKEVDCRTTLAAMVARAPLLQNIRRGNQGAENRR